MKKLKQYLIIISVLLLIAAFATLCFLVPIVGQIVGGIICLLVVYYLVEIIRMIIYD